MLFVSSEHILNTTALIPKQFRIVMQQWLFIQTEKEYEEAKSRFEEIYHVDKTSPDFAEMKLLALLISEYEKKHYRLPPVDPIEIIKIRMGDFGYNPADLAREYGDKGSISKVLNYK